MRRFLVGHEIDGAAKRGWDQLKNGELLQRAEDEGFDILITGDKDDYMGYERTMHRRNITLIVLGTGNWPNVQKYITKIVNEVNAARPEMFIFIEMPLAPKPPYRVPDS